MGSASRERSRLVGALAQRDYVWIVRRFLGSALRVPTSAGRREGFAGDHGRPPFESARASSDQYEGEEGAREVPSLRVNGKDYLGPVGSHAVSANPELTETGLMERVARIVAVHPGMRVDVETTKNSYLGTKGGG